MEESSGEESQAMYSRQAYKLSRSENKKLREKGVIRLAPKGQMVFCPYDTWEQIEMRIKRSQNHKANPH